MVFELFRQKYPKGLIFAGLGFRTRWELEYEIWSWADIDSWLCENSNYMEGSEESDILMEMAMDSGHNFSNLVFFEPSEQNIKEISDFLELLKTMR